MTDEISVIKNLIKHDTRYVRVEVDKFEEAFQWACDELVRRYPGTVDAVETLKGLVNQYLTSNPKGTKS